MGMRVHCYAPPTEKWPPPGTRPPGVSLEAAVFEMVVESLSQFLLGPECQLLREAFPNYTPFVAFTTRETMKYIHLYLFSLSFRRKGQGLTSAELCTQ